MNQTKFSKKVPLVIGILIALLGIMFVVRNGISSRASDEQPLDVTVKAESVGVETIQWTTGNPTQGQVFYATDNRGPWDNASIVPEETSTTDHKVSLTLLTEGQTYYFRIKIGSTFYDNVDGQPWSFIAASSTSATQPVTTAGPRPSSIQHLVIPNPTTQAVVPSITPTSAPAVCLYTTCEEIPPKFGNGCSTQDYITCLHKPTPTP